MSTFEEQIAIYHNWSIEYCNKVIFEYERFLYLRLDNLNIIASDDIYKLWKYHILNTENYSTYCLTKFGKIINHNSFIEMNKETRNNRLILTVQEYIKRFSNIMYQDVWTCNIELPINLISQVTQQNVQIPYATTIMPNMFTITTPPPLIQPSIQSSIQSSTQPSMSISTMSNQSQISVPIQNNIFNTKNTEYPQYFTNKPLPTELKVYIIYKTNYNGIHNKETITYMPHQNDNIDKLKDLLVLNLNVKKENISLYLHPEINVNIFDKNKIIKNNLLNYENKLMDLIAKSYNFIICEIQ